MQGHLYCLPLFHVLQALASHDEMSPTFVSEMSRNEPLLCPHRAVGTAGHFKSDTTTVTRNRQGE